MKYQPADRDGNQHGIETVHDTAVPRQEVGHVLDPGVTLFEFGSLVRSLYINTRAYSMFGLQEHKPERFMELMRISGFHLQCDAEGSPIQAIDHNGANLSDVTRLTREDGTPF